MLVGIRLSRTEMVAPLLVKIQSVGGESGATPPGCRVFGRRYEEGVRCSFPILSAVPPPQKKECKGIQMDAEKDSL